MRDVLLPLMLTLTILVAACGPAKTYPGVDPDFSSNTIHEIKENLLTSGEFNVDGFVVAVLVCPPCPKGKLCQPCPPEAIVVSEIMKETQLDSLKNSDLRLFVDHAGQFEVGRRYRFSIRIADKNSGGDVLNDVDVVGFDPLP